MICGKRKKNKSKWKKNTETDFSLSILLLSSNFSTNRYSVQKKSGSKHAKIQSKQNKHGKPSRLHAKKSAGFCRYRCCRSTSTLYIMKQRYVCDLVKVIGHVHLEAFEKFRTDVIESEKKDMLARSLA